jgi:hypothetical protein
MTEMTAEDLARELRTLLGTQSDQDSYGDICKLVIDARLRADIDKNYEQWVVYARDALLAWAEVQATLLAVLQEDTPSVRITLYRAVMAMGSAMAYLVAYLPDGDP